MSGSDLDDLVDDKEELKKAARDHFNTKTGVQEEDDSPTENEEQDA